MTRAILLLALLCPSVASAEIVYRRVDGRSAVTDPVLARQWDVDLASCRLESNRLWSLSAFAPNLLSKWDIQNRADQTFHDCMVARGYYRETR